MQLDLDFHASRFCLFQRPLSAQHLELAKASVSDDYLATLSEARREEFLSGRYAAYKTLSLLGHQLTRLERLRDGSPQWPEGIVASISHTRQLVFCAASEGLLGLGVDIEKIMSPKRLSSPLLSKIMQTSELELCEELERCHFMPKPELATLVFSAKECVYKALYPLVKRHFGFKSALVRDINTRYVALEIVEANLLPNAFAPRFHIKFRIGQGHVFTWLELQKTSTF